MTNKVDQSNPQRSEECELNINQRFIWGRRTFIVILALLFSLFVYWVLSGYTGFAVLAAQIIPFACLLPGAIKGNHRSYIWICFVSLLYFIFAVQGVFASNADWANYSFLALIAGLFIASMLTSRWQRLVNIKASL